MKNNLKIHIVDYDAGNIKSIKNALTKIGCDAVVTKDPKELLPRIHMWQDLDWDWPARFGIKINLGAS